MFRSLLCTHDIHIPIICVYTYIVSIVFLFQLIYDFKDGGGTFALMSLHPDEISSEDVENFEKIGVEIPSMMYVHKYMLCNWMYW